MPKNLFATLKLENKNILGNVIKISPGKITLELISNMEIKSNSLQYMDVFTNEKIYFSDLPVKILTDNEIQDEHQFSKMNIRQINVTFKSSDIEDLLPYTIGR
ncbi:MAG: hypothetical protein K8S00_07215 [Bacteroidales bacterium]|nr:hypothetical protein [Bacteroidales bacterium]